MRSKEELIKKIKESISPRTREEIGLEILIDIRDELHKISTPPMQRVEENKQRLDELLKQKESYEK